jgi:RecJ-like exonuclease
LLIDVYTGYLRLVAEPLLDLMHAAFVPRLLAMRMWEERACRYCRGFYVTAVVERDDECPGCRLYHRYRCRACGAPIEAHAKGRRRRTCERCRQRSNTKRRADWH